VDPRGVLKQAATSPGGLAVPPDALVQPGWSSRGERRPTCAPRPAGGRHRSE